MQPSDLRRADADTEWTHVHGAATGEIGDEQRSQRPQEVGSNAERPIRSGTRQGEEKRQRRSQRPLGLGTTKFLHGGVLYG